MSFVENPLFSVVIPVFNKKATLQRAVTSALMQTNTVSSIEIIIVDDGSTDGSLQSLDTPPDAPIRILRQENKGASSARNNGIRLASANLIILLDADDELLPNAASTFLHLSENFPEASFFSGSHFRITESGLRYVPPGAWPRSTISLVQDFAVEYRRNRALINSSSACIRRCAFEAIGGFPEGYPLGEDVYVWTRLSMIGPLAHTGEPVSNVYRNAAHRSGELNKHNLTPPFFVSYYLGTKEGRLFYKKRWSLRKLIFHLSVLNVAGCVEKGAKGRAHAVLKHYRDDPVEYIILRCVASCPRVLLRAVRHCRSFLHATLQHLRSKSRRPLSNK